MSCIIVAHGDGVLAIACGVRRPQCSTVGCGRTAMNRCDYPLRGRLQGKTCDKPLCSSCVRNISPGVHYCVPHETLAKAER